MVQNSVLLTLFNESRVLYNILTRNLPQIFRQLPLQNSNHALLDPEEGHRLSLPALIYIHNLNGLVDNHLF